MVNAGGARLTITATPARHGPAGIEPMSGDVIGFVLTFDDAPIPPIYITGDTVWYDGVAEVARRFAVGVVVLFAGAAQTRGPFHLTMDTNDAIETAHAFPAALIVPIHHDGWAHLTQDGADLEQAFTALGLRSRLQISETRRCDADRFGEMMERWRPFGASDSRHIGLNARSSSTSISSEPPPLIPWATRSVAS